MKVIIADYDEEAIRLFEEQCKQFSYVELSGKFNVHAETHLNMFPDIEWKRLL